jgi:hypothetical protein
MKFPILSLGLLSLSAMSVLFMPANAQAQCVAVDVPTQIALHGPDDEANQYSESNFVTEPGCSGSSTVHTGTQVYTGYGDINQVQRNDHYLGGAGEQSGYTDGGYTDPLVFSVPTQVDLNVLPDPALLDYYGNSYEANGYSS